MCSNEVAAFRGGRGHGTMLLSHTPSDMNNTRGLPMRSLLSPNRCVRFALIAGLVCSARGAEKIRGDDLLSADRVSTIEITLADADWQALRQESPNGGVFSGMAEPTEYTYFKADITINGVKVESVGVRKKGFFGSNDRQRPSLKVKFDEFVEQDPIKGLSRLTLNNNKQDTSLLSQFLSYRVFNSAGIHAPRCGFAAVTVNGEHLGVYSNIESIKKPFLARAFGDKTGKLYEGTLTDFYPRAIDKIEAKTSTAEDRAEILRLAELIAPDQDPAFDELKSVVALDEFFRYWAVEGLLRFWDGYAANQNNYFVYIHPGDGLAHFIPWGADSCFTTSGGPFARFGSRGPTSVYAQSFLTSQLFKDEQMANRYRTTMVELLEKVWKEDELLAEADRLEKLLSPHLGDAQRAVPERMDDIREFIRTRRSVVEEELENWPPRIDREPRKPAYTVPVGQVAGTFTTKWSGTQQRDVATAGAAELTIQLDGEPLELTTAGAGAWENRFRGFGPPRGPQPETVSLVLAARRADNQPGITITLSVDRKSFSADDGRTELDVRGSFTETPVGAPQQRGGFGGRGFGGFGGRGGGPRRSVAGKLVLTAAGTAEGDAVSGSLELQVLENRGGFNSQRRGGGFGGFGRGGFGGFGRGGAGALQRAIDSDGDGRISKQEIERAAESLRELDRNKDGELSPDELEAPARPQRPGRPGSDR